MQLLKPHCIILDLRKSMEDINKPKEEDLSDIVDECTKKIKLLFTLFHPGDQHNRMYILGSKKLLSFISTMSRMDTEWKQKVQIINMFLYESSKHIKHHIEVLMITPKGKRESFSRNAGLFETLAKDTNMQNYTVHISNSLKCCKPLPKEHWKYLLTCSQDQLSETVLVVDSLDMNLMRTVWSTQNKLVACYTGSNNAEYSELMEDIFETFRENTSTSAYPLQLLEDKDLVLHSNMKDTMIKNLFQKMQENCILESKLFSSQ
jgi:hypothetical protein